MWAKDNWVCKREFQKSSFIVSDTQATGTSDIRGQCAPGRLGRLRLRMSAHAHKCVFHCAVVNKNSCRSSLREGETSTSQHCVCMCMFECVCECVC